MQPLKRDRLSPAEELNNLKAIFGENETEKMYARLTSSLSVLQNRAQMLLSLITITLTISGFSGPQIARSSLMARLSIAFGLSLVLLSTLVLLAGPLRLSWSTRLRTSSTDETLIKLIEMRNSRTNRFNIAAILLIVGLIGYVSSLISYLITG